MRTALRRLRRAFTDEGALEMAGRTALRMLNTRDRNILVADFRRDDGEPMEEFLMVFARGQRAVDARVALQHLLDPK